MRSETNHVCVPVLVSALQTIASVLFLAYAAFGIGGDATILPTMFVLVSLAQYYLVQWAFQEGKGSR